MVKTAFPYIGRWENQSQKAGADGTAPA